MGTEHFEIFKGKGSIFFSITQFKTKMQEYITFIPNKNMSHLACVSESGAAASQIEHGG